MVPHKSDKERHCVMAAADHGATGATGAAALYALPIRYVMAAAVSRPVSLESGLIGARAYVPPAQVMPPQRALVPAPVSTSMLKKARQGARVPQKRYVSQRGAPQADSEAQHKQAPLTDAPPPHSPAVCWTTSPTTPHSKANAHKGEPALAATTVPTAHGARSQTPAPPNRQAALILRAPLHPVIQCTPSDKPTRTSSRHKCT